MSETPLLDRLDDASMAALLRSQAGVPGEREHGFILVNPLLLLGAAKRIEELSLKTLKLRY